MKHQTDNTALISERLLTPTEVADFLQVSRSFAYHMLQIGDIPCVHIGKARRVRQQDLEMFIRRNRISVGDVI